MEEHVDEILGIKEENPVTEIASSKSEMSDENMLKIIANVILVVGIIASIVLLFTVAIVQVQIQDEYSYLTKTETRWSSAGFAITIGTFLFSIVLWSFFRVIINISISLKELKENKLPK